MTQKTVDQQINRKLDAVLKHFQSSDPTAFDAISKNLADQDELSVERTKKQLVEQFENYQLPVYDRASIEERHRLKYRLEQRNEEEKKKQAVNYRLANASDGRRDVILPAALEPRKVEKPVGCVAKGEDKISYGICPNTGRQMTRPLRYEYDVILADFSYCVVNLGEGLIRLQLSISNLITAAQEHGLNHNQLAKLFLLFIKDYLPHQYNSSLQHAKNPFLLFEDLLAHINPRLELKQLEMNIENEIRKKNELIESFIARIRGKQLALMQIKRPADTTDQQKSKLELFLLKLLYFCVESNLSSELIQFSKEFEDQNGKDADFATMLSQVAILEKNPDFRLTADKPIKRYVSSILSNSLTVNKICVTEALINEATSVEEETVENEEFEEEEEEAEINYFRGSSNRSPSWATRVRSPAGSITRRTYSRGGTGYSPTTNRRYSPGNSRYSPSGRRLGRTPSPSPVRNGRGRGRPSRGRASTQNRQSRFSQSSAYYVSGQDRRGRGRGSSPGRRGYRGSSAPARGSRPARTSRGPSPTDPKFEGRCFRCGSTGHRSSNCFKFPERQTCGPCRSCGFMHPHFNCPNKRNSTFLTPPRVRKDPHTSTTRGSKTFQSPVRPSREERRQNYNKATRARAVAAEEHDNQEEEEEEQAAQSNTALAHGGHSDYDYNQLF